MWDQGDEGRAPEHPELVRGLTSIREQQFPQRIHGALEDSSLSPRRTPRRGPERFRAGTVTPDLSPSPTAESPREPTPLSGGKDVDSSITVPALNIRLGNVNISPASSLK